ncbi:MAG TPA: HAD-IC family P-type ATPase, partial [Hyphomicrobiaceae bacterium]|nr:HAD-IC family P-type ATPase [Hyphomicrobiaceae bacterium]
MISGRAGSAKHALQRDLCQESRAVLACRRPASARRRRLGRRFHHALVRGCHARGVAAGRSVAGSAAARPTYPAHSVRLGPYAAGSVSAPGLRAGCGRPQSPSQRGAPTLSTTNLAPHPQATSAPPADASSPHRLAAEAVVAALGSDAAQGLTTAEARRRLDRHGPNRLQSGPETPWWERLLDQFRNFLVIILLVATVISVVEWLLQDPRETALPYEAMVILAIVILNALLGYFQEARAERSVRALMALAAPESTVIRDGERQRIHADEIVPGDIVLVEAGDRVPADARIVEEANLQTDEAPLTGESMPVPKDAAAIDGDHGIGDRRNMLYSGTVATYGRGRAVVVATGMATEVGRIAGLLGAAKKEATPLQQELDRTGKRLTVIMLGICAVVFATGLLTSTVWSLHAVLALFLFAVALAVAAIPEALPAIVTVGLSLGVRRMAAANAIV